MITKDEILNLVTKYIIEKNNSKTWRAGEDWVQYAGPYFSSDEIVRSVSTLLDGWLTLGKDAIEFETRFSLLLGKKFGIVTNSGSSANLLMMETAKKYYNLPIGTRVICPVAGFPTTINSIIQVGFIPMFVDIELDTLNLNLDQVEIAASHGARVITFAHVLGNPPNMDRLMEIVNKYGLILLEDCCDALGTTYNGVPLGYYGVMSTCSFYPAHHMTMGEGGFVACYTKEQEKIARSFREWGRGCYCVGKKAGLSQKGNCGCRFSNWLPKLPDEIFDHKYVYDNIGYNLKPIEMQCSMGLAQLDKLQDIHCKRKENHAQLMEIFTPYEKYFHFHKAQPNSDVSWFAFPITVKSNAPFKRSDLTTFLENAKIQTRTYFGGNLLLQPAYENIPSFCWLNSIIEDPKLLFPIATKVTTDTFFLGTSPIITPQQLNYIKSKIDQFFKQYE